MSEIFIRTVLLLVTAGSRVTPLTSVHYSRVPHIAPSTCQPYSPGHWSCFNIQKVDICIMVAPKNPTQDQGPIVLGAAQTPRKTWSPPHPKEFTIQDSFQTFCLIVTAGLEGSYTWWWFYCWEAFKDFSNGSQFKNLDIYKNLENLSQYIKSLKDVISTVHRSEPLIMGVDFIIATKECYIIMIHLSVAPNY